MKISVPNRELFLLVQNASCRNYNDKKNLIINYVLNKFELTDEKSKEDLKFRLTEVFLKRMQRKFFNLHPTRRSTENFLNKETIWLDSNFVFNITKNSVEMEIDPLPSFQKNKNKPGKNSLYVLLKLICFN